MGEQAVRLEAFAERARQCAAWRVGLAVAAALLVANCASSNVAGGRSSESKYGVPASPRVIAEGDPVPKGGGREMVGKPYVVGGKRYVPTSTHYSREGWASWYGTAFHGRLTANGEIFDRESIAAAHPTLPLPSYVRVTNVLNKRSMVVRVNDRGPYEQNRVLDVSERVADALDFRRKGVARIRLEYLGKASVRGSDDEKLLATLTTDGSPAPFGRKGATMLADLRDEPAPRPSVAPIRVAEAPAPVEVRASRPVDAETEVEPAPIRVAAAEADAIESAGVDHPAPPQRPTELGGRLFAEPVAPAPARSVAVVTLLPPQRPVSAGIY